MPLSSDDQKYVESLPQFKGVKPDQRVCLNFPATASGSNSANIVCMSPQEFTDHKVRGDFGSNLGAFKQDLQSSTVMTGVYEVPEAQKPPFLQFMDVVGPDLNIDNHYITIRKSLADKVKAGTATSQESQDYDYVLSLEGDYDEADDLRSTMCTKFQTMCPDSKVTVIVTGQIT